MTTPKNDTSCDTSVARAHMEKIGAQSALASMPVKSEGAVPAFEVHVFLLPLNPDAETVARYQATVAAYNEEHPGAGMKAPFLGLCFRETATSVESTTARVMQSARHVHTASLDEAAKHLARDVQWFADKGFEIVRGKLECCAGNLAPTADSACWTSAGYYEAHVRICSQNGRTEPLSESGKANLEALGLRLTKEFGTPVPLSFNLNHDSEGEYQRYLNVRAEDLATFEDRVGKLVTAIKEIKDLHVMKAIKELVVADSYRALDSGWIDFAATA